MSETSATGVIASLILGSDESGSHVESAKFDEQPTTCSLIESASEGSAGNPDQVASTCTSSPHLPASERLVVEPEQASSTCGSQDCQRERENLADECDRVDATTTGIAMAAGVAGDATGAVKDAAASEVERFDTPMALSTGNGPHLIAKCCESQLDSSEVAVFGHCQSSAMASKQDIGGDEQCSPSESMPSEKSSKSVSVASSGNAEVPAGLGDIDGQLEEKASKARLSVTNVKTIIQEVLTDPGVLAMLKNSLEQDTDKLVPATYEPKMTRAKVKQVLAREGNAPVPWPMSPAKNRDLSYLLSDTSFADDEEDDEYSPDPESLDESDDEESTLDGSQLEETMDDESMMSPAVNEPRPAMASTPTSSAVPASPALVMPSIDLLDIQPARHSLPPFVTTPMPTPLSTAVSLQQPTVEISKDSEKHFLKALAELEFDPPIAGRTRSKAPLTEKRLECLEAQLVAPDVSPDMYGLLDPPSVSGADDDDVDREELEWKAFLGSIFTSADDRSNVEEEENDPEYNVLAAIEAEEEEDEDYRNDGKVKIPKAEIHNLMDELVEACEAEDDVPEPLPQHSAQANQSQATSQLSASTTEHKLRYHAPLVKDLVRSNEQARRLNDGAHDALSTNAASVCAQLIPVVTAAESLQIQEHMRKHVQLLLQMFVLTLGHPDLEEHNAMSKKLVVELAAFRDNSLSKSLSHFNAFNLDEAVRITQDSISVGQLVNREDGCSDDVHRGADDEPAALPDGSLAAGSSSHSSSSQQASRQHQGKLPMTDTSLSSGEMEFFANCMACIYPSLMPRLRLSAAKPSVRSSFTASEDNLIVLGLDQFEGTGSKFKWTHLLLLPVHDPTAIKSRVSRVRNKSQNPVSAYLKHNVLPSSMRIIEVFDHSRVCRPIDWDESVIDVPLWLKEFKRQKYGARCSVTPSASVEQLPHVSPAPTAGASISEAPPPPLLVLLVAAAATPVSTVEAVQPLSLSCTVPTGSSSSVLAASPLVAHAALPSPHCRLEHWAPTAAPDKEQSSCLSSDPQSTSADTEPVLDTAFRPLPAVAMAADGSGCSSGNRWKAAQCDSLAAVSSEQPIGSPTSASGCIGKLAECRPSDTAVVDVNFVGTPNAIAILNAADTVTGDTIAVDSTAAASITTVTASAMVLAVAADPTAHEASAVAVDAVAVDAVATDNVTACTTAADDDPGGTSVVVGVDPGQLTAYGATMNQKPSSCALPDDVEPSEGFLAVTSTVAAPVCHDREVGCGLPADAAVLSANGSPTVVLPLTCSPLSAVKANDFPLSGASAAPVVVSSAGTTVLAAIEVGDAAGEAQGGLRACDLEGCMPDVAMGAVVVQGSEGAGPLCGAFRQAPRCSDSSQLSPPVRTDSSGIVVLLTPPSLPELRPPFRTPSPRRRAPRPLAAATPPSAAAATSARYSPLSVKKTLRSPRRRLLRSHVRQLVPKGFVLGASGGASTFSSACSPSKLVARSLTQRAVKTSVGSSGGCGGRARLMPVNPGRDETLAEAAAGLPNAGLPSRQAGRGRGRGRAIKTSAGLGHENGCSDMPLAVAAATSATATSAPDEEDDDLAALMEASTTIRQGISDGSAPCRFKKRKFERNLACLAADIMATDPLREAKDAAVAKAFLMRCRTVLGRDSATYGTFLSALADFDGGSTTQLQLFHAVREALLAPSGGSTIEAATGEAASGTAESRERGLDDLRAREQLLSDFAAFLSPEQAFECGTQVYTASIEYDRARMFLRKLEVYFGRHAAGYQKIVRLLTSWDESRQSLVELKDAVVPLLKGHPHLLDDFRAFFPEEPVPKRFLADYECIDLSACDDDKILNLPSLSGGFEEVEMPDVEDTQATEKCRCGCHAEVAGGSQSLLYRQRLAHCRLCCVRVIGGRLYIHTPRGFKPACVSFADQEVAVQAGDEKALDEGSSPQREFVELVPPAGESEEEIEDGGPAEDVEDDEEADFEAEQDDDDEVDDYAVDYYDDEASDDDARSAVACSPALCSPVTPGSVASPMMVAGEQPIVGAAEPTVAHQTVSGAPLTDLGADAISSSAVSWQATELRPWCRDEDKLILETLQDEDASGDASDAIFQRIACQMQDRTFEQVRARFHHLLDLFANEYGGILDT